MTYPSDDLSKTAGGTLWVRPGDTRAVVWAHLEHVVGRFRAAGWRVVEGDTPGGVLPDPGDGPLAVLSDPWAEPLPEVARWMAEAKGSRSRWRVPRVNQGGGRQLWEPRRGPYTPRDYERLVRRTAKGRWGKGGPRAWRIGDHAWSGFAVAPAGASELLAAGWPPPPGHLALVRRALVYRYGDPAAHDRRELDPWIDDGVATLVDVGCGHGHFGERHCREGRRVIGIEPDWPLARQARGRLDLVLPTTAGRGLAALRPGVDRVIFADVLEHTLDPARALRATARVLSPDGLAICSIPNNAWAPMVRALAAGRWDSTLAGTQARDHFVAFTRASFERLASECGLEVVERHPITAPLDFPTRLWAWLAARTAGGRPDDLMAMQWIVVLRRRESL